MKIYAITTYAENYSIQLERLEKDLQNFKKTTANSVLISDRKTIELLPASLSAGTYNLIIQNSDEHSSHQNNLRSKKISTLEEAIDHAESLHFEKCFIIGGEKIFRFAFENNLIDHCILTEMPIKNNTKNAKEYFPIHEMFDHKWKIDFVENLVEGGLEYKISHFTKI